MWEGRSCEASPYPDRKPPLTKPYSSAPEQALRANIGSLANRPLISAWLDVVVGLSTVCRDKPLLQ